MNIGGLFSNNLGVKPNGVKRYLQPTNDIKEIEEKLANGMSVDDLSEEEYNKLNTFEKAESASFFMQANTERSQAERIAMKIAKGEELTPEEEKLINEKYPDLRKKANQAKIESEELKNRIQLAKTKEEKQQLAMNAISSAATNFSKGMSSPGEVRIKLAAIEKVMEDTKCEKCDMNNSLEYENMKRGIFFNKEA